MEKNHFVLASLYRLKMVQIDEYACLKFSFHHILIESEKNLIFVKNLRYQAFYEILCQSSRLSKWKRIKYISKLQGRFFSSIFPFNYMYIQFQWMAHGFFVFTSFFVLFHIFTFFLVIASNHSLRPTLVEANMKTMSLKSTQKQKHIIHQPFSSRGD